MIRLEGRSNKVRIETGSRVFSAGRERPVLVEATARYAGLRLKLSRARPVFVSWASVYHYACELEARGAAPQQLAERKKIRADHDNLAARERGKAARR